MQDRHEEAFALLAECATGIDDGDCPYYEWKEIYDSGWQNPVELLDILVPSILYEGPGDSPLVQEAFEVLILTCLNQLSLALRNDYRLAKEDWNAMQDNLMGALNEEDQGTLNQESVHFMLHLISEVDLPIAAELMDVIQAWQIRSFESTSPMPDEMTPESMAAAFSEMLKDQEIKSPYDFFQLFSSQLLFAPDELRLAMLTLFWHHPQELIREAALLFLLHPESKIRMHVLMLMQQKHYQHSISPIGFRRLITVRNWLPEKERKRLDKVIKQLRRSGLTCASAEVPKDTQLRQVFVSSIDGAGAQTVVCLFKIGRKFSIVGGVFKEQWGIVDTWVRSDTTKSQCRDIINTLSQELCSLEVNPSYLEQWFPHYLQLNVESNKALIPDILYWIEMLGLDCWQPQRLNAETLLNELQSSLKDKLSKDYIQKSLRRSGMWLEYADFALGWFEQNDETTQCLSQIHKSLSVSDKKKDILIDVIRKVIDPCRDKWLSRFVKLALWAKARCKQRGEPNWQDFVVLALQLRSGVAMEHIPLMTAVAEDTWHHYLEHDST